MSEALLLDELTAADGPVTMLDANSVWTRGGGGDGSDGIKPAYVAALKRDFNALAEKLPTSAAPINEWVGLALVTTCLGVK